MGEVVVVRGVFFCAGLDPELQKREGNGPR